MVGVTAKTTGEDEASGVAGGAGGASVIYTYILSNLLTKDGGVNREGEGEERFWGGRRGDGCR